MDADLHPSCPEMPEELDELVLGTWNITKNTYLPYIIPIYPITTMVVSMFFSIIPI